VTVTGPTGRVASPGGCPRGNLAVMHDVWIESPHNLHCPRCDRRLVQQAGVHFHSRLQSPVYVGEVSTLACPAGHGLPERPELYSHRERRGYAPAASVSRVPPPRR
jgi:hypothetical protein